MLLFDSVSYVFLLLCLCILIFMCVLLCILFSSCQLALFGFSEVFPCFFLSCKANARVKLTQTGHSPHSPQINCVVLCIVCVDCIVLCTVCV